MRILENKNVKYKCIVIIFGILLLFLIFLMERSFVMEEEITKELLKYAYILGIENRELSVLLEEGKTEYPLEEGIKIPLQKEGIADLEIWDGKIHSIVFIEDKVSGKVLSVNTDRIGIEGKGTFPIAQEATVYKLYGEKRVASFKEIKLGSSFQDFILEGGKIVSILITGNEAMEKIRVLLHTSNYEGLLHKELQITSKEAFKVFYYEKEEMTEFSFEADEIFCLTKKEWEQYFPNDSEDRRIWIVPQTNTGKLILNTIQRSRENSDYFGIIECYFPKDEDEFYVINEVLLEEYLNGVVVSEMPASYPLEALKAQAVCARTYAYDKMQSAAYAKEGAHLDDSTNHQVYNNIETAQSVCQAVGETMGEVLYYEGSVAPVYYYSTSCGFGTDAAIWQNGSNLPYLESKALTRQSDEKYTQETLKDNEVFHEFITTKSELDYEYREPYYRWFYQVKELSQEGICEKLETFCNNRNGTCYFKDKEDNFTIEDYRKLGTIQNIRIAKRGSGGVAQQLIIDGSKNSAMVMGEYSIRKLLAMEDGKLTLQDGSKRQELTMLPSAFISLTTMIKGDEAVGYEIYGGGFGHGCGMSQNGAKAMAEAGRRCEEILAEFFPSCETERIYE